MAPFFCLATVASFAGAGVVLVVDDDDRSPQGSEDSLVSGNPQASEDSLASGNP